jgi:LacI family transcriptional regulator
VTIKQVAQEADVSVQTVSRVINNRPDVAAATRQRILEIIDRLGYQPSSIARSLIQGRSCTLGLVGYGLEYFGPSRILSGLEREANELGYSLLLSLMRDPEHDAPQIARDMLSHHVDGIIWMVPETDTNRSWKTEEHARVALPMVFLDTPPTRDLSVVNIDNRNGGHLATRHLIELGCRQIGLITGPDVWWNWAARQRKLGWRDALEEAGLFAQDSLVVKGDWSAASGERGLIRLLEQHPHIDALFASNDQMALGALKAARDLRLQVPEDFALVGYDDIPEAAFFCPPLTTVRQDLHELGRCAVRELGRLIDAQAKGEMQVRPAAVMLQPELIVRASTARRTAH